MQNIKYSNSIISFFIGQSEDIIQNVLKWREHLIAQGFKDKDFLFPRINSSFTKDGNNIVVLSKEEIKSKTHTRNIIKTAFEANNLPYYKPHSFRHSLARKVRKEPNATDLLIALSENDGHKSGMATIISSYGGDYLSRQAKMMKSILLED